MVDDLIVYLVGPDEVLAVPNAANAAQVAGLLRSAAPDGVAVADRHRDLAVLAVQGPRSGELLGTTFAGSHDQRHYADTRRSSCLLDRSAYWGS